MFYKPFLDEFMITWKGLTQDKERRREFLNGRKRRTAAVMQVSHSGICFKYIPKLCEQDCASLGAVV